MDYAKMIMGENAVHIPFNYVRQAVGNERGLILGQETGDGLAFGAKLNHVLAKGDMIFRPHLVIESDMLKGIGVAGIVTSSAFCDVDEWRENGRVILSRI